MTSVLSAAVALTLLVYTLALLLALWRLLRGPAAQDRVLALDFSYVVGMLMLLVLGIGFDSEAYFEAALLMVLFGFVGSVALAKFLLRGEAIE
ncbi:K+/H+ antiporter subunit F [Azohydromonas aeria]|uniref:K+/H+ antiporter subunit F n=1 Tax=Azohydromonas aeria TaxID=2590212 RepID=UPI0012F86AD4|nr:K+/H+ antiporter subunit F [Azohydromonas aeria]